MHEVIRNNFNATVPENGTTYILGDVGMMRSSEFIRDFVNSLNGTKILVLGNHDGSANKMHSLGFDAVMLMSALWIANEYVTLSHCPKQGVFREDTTGMRGATPGENWHGEKKNRKYSVPDEGQFHLHGHLHLDKKEVKLGKQWDIGVVGNSYTPVSISRIESWIALYKITNKK